LADTPNFHCRCILVDEQDNVVGHESKYNCTWPRANPSIPFNYAWLRFSKHDFDIRTGYCFLMVLCWKPDLYCFLLWLWSHRDQVL
jgi:hypothetical protein